MRKMHFGLTALVGAWLVTGCAGSSVDLDRLTADADAMTAEAATMSVSPRSEPLFTQARSLRGRADLEIEDGNKDAAAALLTEASAAAAAASAAAVADRRMAGWERCRTHAQDAYQDWRDATQMLARTETTAGRKAKGVKTGDEPVPQPRDLPPLPSAPGDGPKTPQEVQAEAGRWLEEARDLNVPVADLNTEINRQLAVARSEKTKDEDRAHALNLAGWHTVEMAHRVRAEVAQLECRRLNEAATSYATYRDQTLWAMVDLERSMKDMSQSREQELYSSLKQFEGQFASIRQGARGTILSLSDILFDFNKAELREDARLNLAKVSVILEQFPEMRITVEGHTDNIGSEEYNQSLSEARAQAVTDFLITQNVSSARLSTVGFGMTQPVAENSTEAGRAANRRVDLVIAED